MRGSREEVKGGPAERDDKPMRDILEVVCILWKRAKSCPCTSGAGEQFICELLLQLLGEVIVVNS